MITQINEVHSYIVDNLSNPMEDAIDYISDELGVYFMVDEELQDNMYDCISQVFTPISDAMQ